MAEYNEAHFEWHESRVEDPGIYYGIATSLYRDFSDRWPLLVAGCDRGNITHDVINQLGREQVIVEAADAKEILATQFPKPEILAETKAVFWWCTGTNTIQSCLTVK